MKNMISKIKGWYAKHCAKVAAVSGALACTAATAHAEGAEPTGMDAVIAAIPTLTTMVGKVWELMTSNPLLTLFLAVSMISVGVWVFRMIKRAATR